jgi:hypothetical protein
VAAVRKRAREPNSIADLRARGAEIVDVFAQATTRIAG